MTTTRKRPPHTGAWTTYYDGRESMDAAAAAAMDDAAAAEVDGYPTPDTAAEWLDAVRYRFAATGGGLALHNAVSDLTSAITLVRKALVAAAHMARSEVNEPTRFGSYMPLDTVGLRWQHDLLSLAYDAPTNDRPGWAVEEENQRRWRQQVEAAAEDVLRQWRNSQWVWCLREIADAAFRRFPR